MMKKSLIASLAVMALLAGPVAAQKTNVNAAGGKGLVVVALNALNQAEIELLREANIEVLNDNTVQVPLQVAATICDVEVNAIASSNDQGNKSCEATAEGVEALAN
jgi:type 1 fimbria pilin